MTDRWQLPDTRITRFARQRLGLVMLAGALAISAALFATGPAPVPEPPQEKAWPVSVVTAEPAQLRPTFRAYGKVESRNLANLSADLFAVIKAIHVKEGDLVKTGTLLVELDDGELALDVSARSAELSERAANVRSIESELRHLRAMHAEHRSLLAVATAKLTRHQELLGNRLISQSLYDEVLRQTNQVKIDYQDHSQRLADLPNRLQAARALQDRAKAALARAQLTAAKTKLVAPFDGIVLAVPAALGARAQPGTPLVSVADAGAYEVRVPVPPSYTSHFALHATQSDHSGARAAEISALLPTGTSLPFSRLAGAVKTGQTSADALFAWHPGPGEQPAPVGSTVELQIALPVAREVVALPAQALYENQRVYVVEQERLRPVVVQRVGERQTDENGYQILVRSAQLTAGSQVIATQLPKAIAGLKVATVNGSPTTESEGDILSARDAAEMVRAKQERVRKEAGQRVTPAQISLPAAGQPASQKDDTRPSSRRYRMM